MPDVPVPPWLSPVKRLIRKADDPIYQQVMGSNPIGGFFFLSIFVYNHIESDQNPIPAPLHPMHHHLTRRALPPPPWL